MMAVCKASFSPAWVKVDTHHAVEKRVSSSHALLANIIISCRLQCEQDDGSRRTMEAHRFTCDGATKREKRLEEQFQAPRYWSLGSLLLINKKERVDLNAVQNLSPFFLSVAVCSTSRVGWLNLERK